MAFPFNQLFNFGGQGAPQGVPATPIMLELARQNAEAQNAIDPKKSTPAYSPWQLAGTIAKGLQGWTDRGQLNDASQQKGTSFAPSSVAVAPSNATSSNDTGGSVNQDASLDPTFTNPQKDNVGTNNAGPYDRSKLQKEAESNPRVKQLFKAMMVAEAGPDAPPESMAAIGETAANRTYAYNGMPSPRKDLGPFNGSLWRTLQDDYYAPWKDGNLKRSFAELNNPEINAKAEQAYSLVMGGSDFAKGNLHNGSAGVAAHAAQYHGNFMRDPYNGEGYSTKIGGPGDPDERPLLSKIPKRDTNTQVASAEGTGGLPMTDTGFIPGNMPPRSALGLDGAPNTPQQPTPAAQPQGPQVAQNVPPGGAGPSPQDAPAGFPIAPPNVLTQRDLSYLSLLPENLQKLEMEGLMRKYEPQVYHSPQGDFIFRNGKFEYVGKPQEGSVNVGNVGVHGPVTNKGPNQPYNTPMLQGSEGGNAPSTVQTLGNIGREQEAFNAQRKAVDADYTKINEAIPNIGPTHDKLAAALNLLEDPKSNIYTGFLAKEAMELKQALALTDPNAAANDEVVRKLLAQNVLNEVSNFVHQTHVGRFLQSEMNLTNLSAGSENMSREGLKALLKMNMHAVEYQDRYNNFALDTAREHGGVLPQDWFDRKTAWLNDKNNHMFKPGELAEFRRTIGTDKQAPTQNPAKTLGIVDTIEKTLGIGNTENSTEGSTEDTSKKKEPVTKIWRSDGNRMHRIDSGQ